ncbi:MAG: FTR1 family protein, partial [Bifidobacteriaceae bacterium]|nr:FTR1 family protein [Bifidobacteriaceae bacterium]
MMRRLTVWLSALVGGLVLSWTIATPALAADDATWANVADQMSQVLDQAYITYQGDQLAEARDLVNEAYYGYYEAKGFEKTVMAYISGQSATDVEYQFTLIKRSIMAGEPDASVASQIDQLKQQLSQQANQLDGPPVGPVTLFMDALMIILREGIEAILVIAAIIAYLVKAGKQQQLKLVYSGAGLAIAASAGLAIVLNLLTNLAEGQEVIEGVTILMAMVMLIWASSWIAAKSETAAWVGYIESKVTSNVKERSAWTLAFVAFLAVFREGAEVILLYQAL